MVNRFGGSHIVMEARRAEREESIEERSIDHRHQNNESDTYLHRGAALARRPWVRGRLARQGQAGLAQECS